MSDFVTPWTTACQPSLPMGFFRQEYLCGLPFPLPRDLPDPGFDTVSPKSPALAMDSLPLSHLESSFLLFILPLLLSLDFVVY